MPPIDEPSSFSPPPGDGRRARAKPESPDPAAAAGKRLVAVTIDPDARAIVGFERIDEAGARHELTPEEATFGAVSRSEDGLERLVELAFQAGIDCVLGAEAAEEEEPAESADDAELRRMLLKSLIENSAARRLLERDALSRTLVDALLAHAAVRTSRGEGGPTH